MVLSKIEIEAIFRESSDIQVRMVSCIEIVTIYREYSNI